MHTNTPQIKYQARIAIKQSTEANKNTKITGKNIQNKNCKCTLKHTHCMEEKRKRILNEDEVMHTHTDTQRRTLAKINFPQKSIHMSCTILQARQQRQQQQQKRDGIEFGDLEQYNHHRCPIEKVLKLFSL